MVIKGYEDAPYGVLEIDSPTQHAYDEHDINFLTGFANVLAEAVATQSRMQALRMLVEEKSWRRNCNIGFGTTFSLFKECSTSMGRPWLTARRRLASNRLRVGS